MLETIFLYIILHDDDDSSGERFRTQMPDMQTCLKVLENANFAHPNSSEDFEAMGVMFCGTSVFHRHYDSTWGNDAVKNSSSHD